jgi:hypothetical protein
MNTFTFRCYAASAITVSTVLLVMAICSPLRAEVVFSNLGPSDTFSDSIGYSIGGQHVAGRFTVGPQNYLLSSAEMALTDDNGGANSFSIYVRTDDGGLPGIALADSSVSGVPPYPPTLVTVDFSSSSLQLLAGTTYWLTSEGLVEPTGGTGGWWANSVGQTGNVARVGSQWMYFPNESSTAFRITGTAIPEPGTILLASIAVFGAFAHRSHRTRPRHAMTGDRQSRCRGCTST